MQATAPENAASPERFRKLLTFSRNAADSRRAFTLIELLVVIAIIAILAAILFPVFAQARGKARQSACLSNTKQIGNSLLMYAQDYDETYPGYRFAYDNPFATDTNVGASAKSAIFISQVLFPYTKNYDIWRCPSNPDSWVNIDKDGVMKNAGSGFQSYGGQNSYGVNNYLFPSRLGRPDADIKEPSNTVGMIDAFYYNVLPKGPASAPCVLKGDPTGTAFVTGGSYPKYYKNFGNSYLCFSDCPEPGEEQSIKLAKERHQGFINVIWMDGHSKAVAYDQLVLDKGLTVGGTTSLWDPYKQGCN